MRCPVEKRNNHQGALRITKVREASFNDAGGALLHYFFADSPNNTTYSSIDHTDWWLRVGST